MATSSSWRDDGCRGPLAAAGRRSERRVTRDDRAGRRHDEEVTASSEPDDMTSTMPYEYHVCHWKYGAWQ